jgi:TolB protein
MPDSSQVLVHTGFTASDSDNSRLAFVPLDGISEPAEIIENGFFQAPAVAANGRFFSYSDRDPIGNHWLSVRDIDRDQQVELIHHLGVVAMGFSPTSPRLAYTSPDFPELSFYGPLRLIDLDSGDSRILIPEEVMAFFWSPDGRSIAYFTLATVDDPFRFEDGPVAGLIDQELSVSITSTPDAANKRVLARMQLPPDQETRIGLSLSIVDVDSGDTRLLTTFEPSNVFFNQFLPFFDQYALSHRLWSPDSQALVLPMEDEQDRNFIVVVPVDGSEPLPIARGVAAFWSRQ